MHIALKGLEFEMNYVKIIAILFLFQIFVIGVCAIHSILPIYMRGYENNYFEFKPSYFTSLFISILVIFQINILYLQIYFGSQFFIPTFLLPGKHHYFVKLPRELIDLEQGVFQDECVICMNALSEVPCIQKNTERKHTPYIERMKNQTNKIMKTPCGHKFHISCLLEWMAIKMECPTFKLFILIFFSCRRQLPPL